mgnify:FL=1
MQLLFASTNKGKIIEIQECLAGTKIELLTLEDFNLDSHDVHEHGLTYEENALIKARYFFEKSGIPTFTDDSGIIVDALKNELGVQTRRWGAGSKASDEEWINFFLDRMSREANKQARFITCIAYIDHKGTEHIFEGHCDGVITETVEAPYLAGLPISGCFRPSGFEKVFSALSVDDKNRISHRGRAMQGFIQYLKKIC